MGWVDFRGDSQERKMERADTIIASYIDGVVTILDQLGYVQSEMDALAGVHGCIEERNVSSAVCSFSVQLLNQSLYKDFRGVIFLCAVFFRKNVADNAHLWRLISLPFINISI